jgi:hyperosmotically inducible periplasmic protein
MSTQTWIIAIIAGAAAVALPESLLAAGGDHSRSSAENRIVQAVRKEINTLTNYGVFDHVAFTVNGQKVVLKGHASRPTLKDSAERVVQKIEGVERVENEIKVLPFSRFDDRIRAHAYVRIYGHTALARYNPNRGAPIFTSLAQYAGGITNDPPIGNHPIHIIVDNGNITLEGIVDSEADKSIAFMEANSTPGAFSVTNNLRVAKSERSSK